MNWSQLIASNPSNDSQFFCNSPQTQGENQAELSNKEIQKIEKKQIKTKIPLNRLNNLENGSLRDSFDISNQKKVIK